MRCHPLRFEHDPRDCQRQRRVVGVAVKLDHRNAAHDVVGIEERVDMSAARGRLRELRDGRRIADGRLDRNDAAADILGTEQRRRESADLLRLVGEAEPQNDWPAANGIGEPRVEVELGAQPVERRDIAAVFLEIALRQPLEDVDARRSVRFGEHDVEPDGSRLIAIQQLRSSTGQACRETRANALRAASWAR